MGWHYETAAEARERAARKRSMSREAYRAWENEEHRKFVANPENRYKAGSAADRRRQR